MVIGRFIGWLLIFAALGFTIVEISAQSIGNQYGVLSAYTVLHTLIPGELIQTRIIISRALHPILWDPFIRSLLSLPGWLILGLPGIFLVWKFRKVSSETSDDARTSTYEDIVAAAEEFDEMNDDEGFSESQYGKMDEFDPNTVHLTENLDDNNSTTIPTTDIEKNN